MTDQNNNDVLSDLARTARRLALGTIALVITATLLILVFQFDLFKFDNNTEEVVIPQMQEQIENGIHTQSGLIATEGYELVYKNCGGCHSHKLVIQNRATEQGWTDIIKWMQESHNLWELGENQEKIVKYLSSNYGPQLKGRRENLKKIDWYLLE